jgi:hypothetical protein
MEAHVDNRRLVFTNLNILHAELLDVHQHIIFTAAQEVKNHSKKFNSDLIAIGFPSFVLMITDNIVAYSIHHFKKICENQTCVLISHTDFFKDMSIKKVDYERRLNAYRRKYYKK